MKFLKALEKKHNVKILNFQYFSGNLYKAGFDIMIHHDNTELPRTYKINVRLNEKYEDVIRRTVETYKEQYQ